MRSSYPAKCCCCCRCCSSCFCCSLVRAACSASGSLCLRSSSQLLCRDALTQLSKPDLDVGVLDSHDSLAIRTVLESIEEGHLKVLCSVAGTAL